MNCIINTDYCRIRPTMFLNSDTIVNYKESRGYCVPVLQIDKDKYKALYYLRVATGILTEQYVKIFSDCERIVEVVPPKFRDKNLNYFEEAESLAEALRIGALTQEQLGICLGYSQGTISNKLRLLRLSNKVRNKCLEYKLVERQVRVLLKLNEELQLKVIELVYRFQLNTERTDQLVKIVKKFNLEQCKEFLSGQLDVMFYLNIDNLTTIKN